MIEEKPFCPKCKSENIEICERGFKLGRAVLTSVILSPVGGAVIGMIGRKKLVNRCMNCGKTFKHKAIKAEKETNAN